MVWYKRENFMKIYFQIYHYTKVVFHYPTDKSWYESNFSLTYCSSQKYVQGITCRLYLVSVIFSSPLLLSFICLGQIHSLGQIHKTMGQHKTTNKKTDASPINKNVGQRKSKWFFPNQFPRYGPICIGSDNFQFDTVSI